MNAIEELAGVVRRRLPRRAAMELIRPRDERSGRWTLDVELDGWLVVIVWLPARGFGLTAGPVDDEAAYGENLEEAYPGDPTILAERAIDLLRRRLRTAPPRSVALRELRARCGLSQAEVAARLEVQQGTVSKLERSADIDVKKLASLVRAMGGELELWVRFPLEAPVRLLPPEAESRPPARARPTRRRRSGP